MKLLIVEDEKKTGEYLTKDRRLAAGSFPVFHVVFVFIYTFQ